MDAKNLIARFRSLPDAPVPPMYTWERHRYELRWHVLHSNISEFLRWSTIQATMFVEEAPYIRSEYDALVDEWPACLPALAEGSTGNPKRLSFAPDTSGNMVHQAYHLLQLRRVGIDFLNVSSVVEFGGGYGAMARLFNRLGYTGKYYIHDLLEFQWLQEYYLEAEGVPVSFGPYPSADLLIACYSMSETAVGTRVNFMSLVAPKNILIAYADVYGEYQPLSEIPSMLSRMGYTYATSAANPPGNNYAVGRLSND